MRNTGNIRQVAELDIDMMGFIFWQKSSRYVRMISSKVGTMPDYSSERYHQLSDGKAIVNAGNNPKRVGVFVDDMPQNIVTRIYNYNLDYVQLHGNESIVMIDNLVKTVDPDIHKNIKIIKALSITTPEDIDKYKEYEGHVDMFLFDTKCDTVGGSGKHFDWSLLERYDGNTPFLLSGGIGPNDVERVKNFHHPKCVGIDINSRFETEPAMKDVDLLRSFVSQVKGV